MDCYYYQYCEVDVGYTVFWGFEAHFFKLFNIYNIHIEILKIKGKNIGIVVIIYGLDI